MPTTTQWTSGSGPSDFNQKSFSASIARYFPQGQAPLFALSSMQKPETAVDVEHGYFAKTFEFPKVTMNGAIADGVITAFTVVDSSQLSVGSVLQNFTTGEQLLVTAIGSATAITVRRAVGDVTGAAVGASEVLYQVGRAYEEGSALPSPYTIVPVRVTNYTQIFRNVWKVTGTAAAVQQIAGNGNISENKEDCAMAHAVDIETAILFGQKYTNTLNSAPLRKMGGLEYHLRQFAASNIVTAGSTTTFTQFETAIDPVFNQVTDPKTGNERYAFVGKDARKVINNIGRLNGTYQLQQGVTDFGLRFNRITLTRGDLVIIEHPLLNTNAVWSKMAMIVDLPTFNLAYLAGRDTYAENFNQNGQLTNGTDAVTGSLLTECTAVFKNPSANGIIKNLTAAAVG